jgi:threonine/homoserine/homoserine lactone efflux protein
LEDASPGRAWLALGLAAGLFAMAVGWLVIDPATGEVRSLGPAVLALFGVIDLCWAAASFLPETRGGAMLRGIVRALRVVLLAVGIAVLARLALLPTGATLSR